jgi:hypothetical protein
MIHVVLVLFAMSALAAPSAAQSDSATLFVQVADSIGHPLNDAGVFLTSLTTHTAGLTGRTDLHGRVSFQLQPGKYDVVVRRIGFSPRRDTVDLAVGHADTLSVRLQVDPLTIARLNDDRMMRDTSQPRLVITRANQRPPVACVGVDSILVKQQSVTVTGYRSSPVTPADVFGAAFRHGSLLVLDLFDDHPREVGAMVTCVRWRAVMSGLPPGELFLVVRHMEGAGTRHLLARRVDTRNSSAAALDP